jgi:hypothetical protein
MRRIYVCAWLACLFYLPASLPAQDTPAEQIEESQIDELRAELARLRADYDQRIADLERRLAAAETEVAQASSNAQPQLTPAVIADSAGVNNREFNPAIGVIFQGQAWDYSEDPGHYEIPGFPFGGEAGPVPEGLSLGETEIDISANVDDLFTAWLTVPIVIEDGETEVEIEEAWIETLALPSGFSARMGRMFSNIGYLNQPHSHSWDFVDQPLPYQAMLGNQYIDDGLRLSWVAPTALYFELASEILRGDRYPAAGAANSGFGSWTARATFGGDVGISNYWQAGLSRLSADATDRPSGDEDDPLLFTGTTDLTIAEFVWKWAPNGNWRQRNFKFQAEYLWQNQKGYYALPEGGNPAYDADQEGWYLQAVFQPFPQWRFGVRYDALESDDPGVDFAGTLLDPGDSDPWRYSLMADWSHSEFSRIRLQYTHDEATVPHDDQWGLQYIYSIGAHGAHSF